VTKKLDKKNGDFEYFEKLESKFDAFMSDYDVQRRMHLIFSVLLDGVDIAGKKVLEVGCGTGKFSEVLAGKGAELTVIDIGKNLVETVTDKIGCQGIAADACDMPFEDGSFDIIVSSECVEHTSDPLKAIEEMCRVCRKGGCICLTTPNKLWYPVLAISQMLGLRKFAGVENWIFPVQAKKLLSANGFDAIKLRGCHLWPFQLKFTRPALSLIDRKFPRLYPFMINFGVFGQKR
jgi:ubiquinone/menaquinone biosynthesis C-methylase UbiE